MEKEQWRVLLDRVEKLESELSLIKKIIAIHTSKKEEDGLEIVEPINLAASEQQGERNNYNHREVKKGRKEFEKKSRNWEKELGQKWLPRVFLIVLVMGFVWAFVAVSQEGLDY